MVEGGGSLEAAPPLSGCDVPRHQRRRPIGRRAGPVRPRRGRRVPMSSEKGELTPKQERFVQEYLVDLNATQAAIRAGYSKKTATEQASRLLTNVKVSEA